MIGFMELVVETPKGQTPLVLLLLRLENPEKKRISTLRLNFETSGLNFETRQSQF